MSKLSDKVKEIKERESQDVIDWDEIAKFAAKNVLDVDFDAYENLVSYILKINKSYGGFTVYVQISKNRTSSYDVYVSKESNFLNTLILELDDKSKAKTKSFFNLEYNNELVDIGQLVYYIQRNLKSFSEKESSLNKEIDNGFRKQDSRMPLGGETLENDIAFNEYLHRKYKGIC